MLACGFDAFGVEPNDSMRDKALALHPSLLGRFPAGLSRFGRPFPDRMPDGFDAVVCSAVLMHLYVVELPSALASLVDQLRVHSTGDESAMPAASWRLSTQRKGDAVYSRTAGVCFERTYASLRGPSPSTMPFERHPIPAPTLLSEPVAVRVDQRFLLEVDAVAAGSVPLRAGRGRHRLAMALVAGIDDADSPLRCALAIRRSHGRDDAGSVAGVVAGLFPEGAST